MHPLAKICSWQRRLSDAVIPLETKRIRIEQDPMKKPTRNFVLQLIQDVIVVIKQLLRASRACVHGWGLHHFPGQPGPMLDNPFSEVTFPDIQSKPPLAQLEAISSRPITCDLGEETDPTSLQPPFRQFDEVSPQPPFLQAEQPQVPQPLPISLVLQTLPQLRCPSLDTLQPLNVSLGVRGPTLNTAFEVRPHQCRVQGHDHCPSPAGHAIPDTSQDAIGFLDHLGTLLAHIQAAVNQHPQVLLCWAAFQPLFPKPVALHGVAVAQVQDLALSLVKPHTIDLGPWIQPVQVPLQSLPALQQINTPAQLGVICKLTEGALDPFVQILDKDVKQNWPQHRALGTPLYLLNTAKQSSVRTLDLLSKTFVTSHEGREEVKNLGSGNTAQIPRQRDKQTLPPQPYTSTLECVQARAHSDDNDGRAVRFSVSENASYDHMSTPDVMTNNFAAAKIINGKSQVA
ncbi:LOW QUALITY PROTEIN: hypothetical protein QYF61_003582, partial [Mycteria americana]